MRIHERVARAIHSTLAGSPDWETLATADRQRYADAARKAIAALRTPTDAMLAEGNRRDMPHDAGNIWERMIFVALYEGED